MSARFYYNQKDYIEQLNAMDDIVNSAPTAGNQKFTYGDYVVAGGAFVPIVLPTGSQNLVTGFAYRVELVTIGTGTVSGAVYTVRPSTAGVWALVTTARASNTSNHPLLRISLDGTKLEVYHNHASPYTIRASVKSIDVSINNVSPNIFGVEGFFSSIDGVPAYNGSTIWTQGSLTNLSQLTNGPGYITNSITGSFTASQFLFSGSNGTAGQTRYNKDTGALAWITGLDGSAGGTNYIFYDNVGGATRFTMAPDGTSTHLVAGTQRLLINSSGTTTTGNATIQGSLTFAGTGGRITGDFSNGTVANRVMFQTTTANATTTIDAIPNGTGNIARYTVYNTSTPTNAGTTEFGVGPSSSFVSASRTGSGTYLPLVFNTSNAEAGRFDTAGNLLVGTSSGSIHRMVKSVSNDAGNGVFEVVGGSNATSALFYGVSSFGANAANAAVKIGKDNATSRSINAGGTVNASGADYAEYMRKVALSVVFAKGAVVGINVDGLLTDKWADSISFMVKSTSPSYVGGDDWSQHLGPRPEAPAEDASEEDKEAFEIALADYDAAVEEARQWVDRIAYAGQVPVNVMDATPGQYIVPVQDGEGIKGVAISEDDITFAQYRKAVGVVQNILPDGRANIRVKAV